MRALAVLLLLFLSASCSAFAADRFGYEHRDGAAEARADLARGVVKEKIFGLPEPEFDLAYEREAKARYGVVVDRIALCEVDDSLVRYAEAYNRVVELHLRKKYSRDVLDELRASLEARIRNSKQTAPPPAKPSASQPAATKRPPIDPVAAMREYGLDPQTEFKTQLARGPLPFLAFGDHPLNEHASVPGLTQAEVDEYVTHRNHPVEIRFDDASFMVPANHQRFDAATFWAAVDAFLTTYNRLVLAELQRRDHESKR